MFYFWDINEYLTTDNKQDLWSDFNDQRDIAVISLDAVNNINFKETGSLSQQTGMKCRKITKLQRGMMTVFD